MRNESEIESVRDFCDKRANHGRNGAVRDPSDKRGLKNKFIETVLQQAFFDEVKLDGSETVLDLGCGTGLATETIAPRASLTAGLDISFKMLQHAVRVPIPRSVFSQYDGLRMPFATSQFDSIFTREMFHLLSDPVFPRVIEECKRTLKLGKRLISIELCSYDPNRQQGRSGRFESRPETICQIISAQGFVREFCYPIRRGRSLTQYLIRYGFYKESQIPDLARRERELVRGKASYAPRYNADYLFVFRRKD